jgi:hypothetical protein
VATRIVHPRVRHLSAGEEWLDPLTERPCEFSVRRRGYEHCLNRATHMTLREDRTDLTPACFSHAWWWIKRNSDVHEGVDPTTERFYRHLGAPL